MFWLFQMFGFTVWGFSTFLWRLVYKKKTSTCISLYSCIKTKARGSSNHQFIHFCQCQSNQRKKKKPKKNQSSLFFLCYHVLGECLPKRCGTHVNAIVWLWMLCFQYTVNVIVLFLPKASTRGLPDDHEGPVRVIEIPGQWCARETKVSLGGDTSLLLDVPCHMF